MKRLHNDRGVALILTILVVSLIVGFTIQFNKTMYKHVESSRTNKDDLKALYAAKSGVQCALALLKADDTPEVTTLFELKLAASADGTSLESICAELGAGPGQDTEDEDSVWGDAEEESPEEKDENADTLSPCSLGSFKPFENCEFEIIDECGKIQLNSLPGLEKGTGTEAKGRVGVEGLLMRYFDQFGLGEDEEIGSGGVSEIVYAILNWIDTDDINRDAWDYSEDGSKNGPLYALDELRLIEGLDDDSLTELTETAAEFSEELGELAQMGSSELFHTVTEHLTVFAANDGKININTASEEVILSLDDDMDESQFGYMQDYRCGGAANSTELTSTNWYHSGAGVLDAIKFPEDLITTKSDLFRIISTGSSGDLTKRIVAVAKRETKGENIQGGSDFRIIFWTVE